MLTLLDKETHVFLKTEKSFTTIAKRKRKGTYQVFTTIKLESSMADQMNELFESNLEVTRVNFIKGFLFIKLKEGSSYMHIVRAIKTVIYGVS